LNQKPADDGVSDRDFVNVAPLQFPEEVPRIHGLACATQFDSEQGQGCFSAFFSLSGEAP
jgi:hypothetical protein